MPDATTVRPLEGVTVLEIASYYAGPMVGRHLYHLGARVVVVVPPRHARGAAVEQAWRPETTSALRSGKACEQLDLKSAEGQTRVRELIRASDGAPAHRTRAPRPGPLPPLGARRAAAP